MTDKMKLQVLTEMITELTNKIDNINLIIKGIENE
jgi:hypothetical protein